MSEFGLLYTGDAEEGTVLHTSSSPPVNRAFLDKTIDWPSPAGTESSRAMAVWYPTFDRDISLSPTISSRPTPHPIPASVAMIASQRELRIPSNANVFNAPKSSDDIPSKSHPVQAQKVNPVYPITKSLSLMEEALYLIREDLDQYAGVIEENFVSDLLHILRISQSLQGCDLLMKHGRSVEASECYDNALKSIPTATTNSGSFMLIDLILAGCKTRGKLVWTSVYKFLSQAEFSLERRSSSQAIAILFLQHPRDSDELCVLLYQCLIDYLSTLLSSSSMSVIWFKCSLERRLHRLNHRFQAMQIFSDIRNRLDHFVKQWDSTHHIAFLAIADMFVSQQDTSTAEQCYRLGLPAALHVSLAQRHLLAPEYFYAARCYASQHHYSDALNLVDDCLHGLLWAPPFQRALESEHLELLRSRILDAKRQEASGIDSPSVRWWYEQSVLTSASIQSIIEIIYGQRSSGT